MHKSNGRGPLEGIRVLDLTIAMAGPLCTQRLGEMGADVIKIEAPGGGDFSRHAPMAGVTRFGDAMCFTELNQNKRSLVLDLKSDEGRGVLQALVAEADVLVQNFRPRVARKLGIDYATLGQINPRLVHGSISGYGETGPMADRPGQDLLVQSFCGLTMNGGRRDGLPHPSPLYMVDVTASHMLCEGILAALVARGRTGAGEEVKVTMIGAIMEMQCQEVATFLAAEAAPRRGEAPQVVSVYQEPPYGVFKCAEGFLAIAQADLDVLAHVLDRPDLAALKAARPADADGDAMTDWRDRVYAAFADLLARAPAETWDRRLDEAGVWCMVVNDYTAFLSHPQAADLLVEVEHPVGGRYRSVAPGIGFSGAGRAAPRPAPLYGQHSAGILAEAGFSEEAIERLIAAGVVVSSRQSRAA
ncbi:MAG: CoA transferase [Rhodobacteraceae bacterium CG17_big_fil_post_rev_8_21_14_2_50_65_11]|nr:MAG: CoA transferase [Rhodobacteraceae bacterium CG17_big_fil_post_rev_8_21_14_2_50_65_11]